MKFLVLICVFLISLVSAKSMPLTDYRVDLMEPSSVSPSKVSQSVSRGIGFWEMGDDEKDIYYKVIVIGNSSPIVSLDLLDVKNQESIQLKMDQIQMIDKPGFWYAEGQISFENREADFKKFFYEEYQLVVRTEKYPDGELVGYILQDESL
jgi:hypothetical protein